MSSEEFSLTPTRELTLFKELLDERIEKYKGYHKRQKSWIRKELKKQTSSPNPDVRRLQQLQKELVELTTRLNTYSDCKYLFKELKQKHNDIINKIKEDGQLLKDIQDSEAQLKHKKETAKERKLKLRPKKKEKTNA